MSTTIMVKASLIASYVVAALLSSATAWNIPIIAKIRIPSQVQGVFRSTTQFQTKQRMKWVGCRMSGSEQRPETSGSFLQGALLRILGPMTISFIVALEGHIQVTGPLSKLDLVDGLMAFFEVFLLSELFFILLPNCEACAELANSELQLVQDFLSGWYGHSNICL